MEKLYKIKFIKDTELKKIGDIVNCSKKSAESSINSGYAEYIKEKIEIPKQLQNPEFRFVKLGLWNEWARYEKDKVTKKTKVVEKILVTPENFKLIDKKIWKPLGKAPFEYQWENKDYSFDNPSLVEHINKGFNFGIIAGFGKLVILDIDDPKLAEEMEKKLDTYTIKTGSGGRHFYFIIEDEK